MKWYVLHTHSEITERQLREQIERCPDVAEAYYPLQERAFSTKNGDKRIHPVPLLPSIVFARGKQIKIRRYIKDNFIHCSFVLDSTRDFSKPMVVADDQMQLFRQICDNYSRAITYIQKPYSQFTDCDIVSFRDGPLAGMKGKFKEIKRDRKVIFCIDGWTFAIANAQRYAINVECPALKDTEQRRLFQLIDACLAHLQSLGCIDNAAQQLRIILTALENNANLNEWNVALPADINLATGRIVSQLTPSQMSDFSTLSQNILIRRKEQHLDTVIPSCPLRPFLTQVSGTKLNKEVVYVEHNHANSISGEEGFTEIIKRVTYDEPYTENSTSDKIIIQKNLYFAHIGLFRDHPSHSIVLAINFSDFYSHYLSMEDKNLFLEKLEKIGAPLFHNVLTGTQPDGIHFFPVKIGNDNVTCLGMSIHESEYKESHITQLIDWTYSLCLEIIGNTRLLTWRRYLSTVWLRK